MADEPSENVPFADLLTLQGMVKITILAVVEASVWTLVGDQPRWLVVSTMVLGATALVGSELRPQLEKLGGRSVADAGFWLPAAAFFVLLLAMLFPGYVPTATVPNLATTAVDRPKPRPSDRSDPTHNAEAIWDDVRSHVPYEQQAAAAKYIGLHVTWSLALFSFDPELPGAVRHVWFTWGEGHVVGAELTEPDYASLKPAATGTTVMLKGQIKAIESTAIEIGDAELVSP